MLCAQAWKPSSQHAGEKRGVAGLLLGEGGVGAVSWDHLRFSYLILTVATPGANVGPDATCARVLFEQVWDRDPYQTDTSTTSPPQKFPAATPSEQPEWPLPTDPQSVLVQGLSLALGFLEHLLLAELSVGGRLSVPMDRGAWWAIILGGPKEWYKPEHE